MPGDMCGRVCKGLVGDSLTTVVDQLMLGSSSFKENYETYVVNGTFKVQCKPGNEFPPSKDY